MLIAHRDLVPELGAELRRYGSVSRVAAERIVGVVTPAPARLVRLDATRRVLTRRHRAPEAGQLDGRRDRRRRCAVAIANLTERVCAPAPHLLRGVDRARVLLAGRDRTPRSIAA